VTPTIVWAKVTPTPTKPVVADETPTVPVEETPTKPVVADETPTVPVEETPTKNSTPGFAAIFAIAGLLAIAYVMMRRRG
jgi:PGF-CTERM protein